jgi:hypothetical protein
MPSPRMALRTSSVQASGSSRRSPGTPQTELGLRRSRRTAMTRSPAGRVGAGRMTTRWPCPYRRPGDQPDDLVVGDVARGRDDDVPGPIGGGPERAQVLLRQARTLSSLPAISRPRGVSPNIARSKERVDVLAGVVEVGADLLDDDGPLRLDLLAAQVWPNDQLAQHVHTAGGLAQRAREPSRRWTRGPWRR